MNDLHRNRLDEWAIAHNVAEAVDAIATGNDYADALVRRIADDIADLVEEIADFDQLAISELDPLVLQSPDDGARACFELSPRKSPREDAVHLWESTSSAIERLRARGFFPPDLEVRLLPVQRVAETTDGGITTRYTAIVVELVHPLARKTELVIPTELSGFIVGGES